MGSGEGLGRASLWWLRVWDDDVVGLAFSAATGDVRARNPPEEDKVEKSCDICFVG